MRAIILFVDSKEIEIRSKGCKRRKEVPSGVLAGLTRAGGYSSVVSSLPNSRTLHDRARVHGALAAGVRLRMLWALSRSELCPCLLTEVTGLSDSKLSYHLRILKDAGLVRVSRTKSWRVYSITEQGRAEIVNARRRRKG